MSRAPQSRIIPLATSAAVATGLGMMPLHRLPPPVRTAYVVLPAAAVTGVLVAALRHAASGPVEVVPVEGVPEPGAPRPRVRRQVVAVALPVLVGGLTAGAGAASIVVDRCIESSLRRHGMPAPRLMMGLGTGVLSLAMDVLADRVGDGEPADDGPREPAEGPDGAPADDGEGAQVDDGAREPAEDGVAPTSPPSAR